MIDVATSRRAGRVLAGLFTFEIIFLWSPIVLLYIFSFNQGTVLAFPFSGFTLDWYKAIFDSPLLLKSLHTSATIAALASTASVIVGLLMSVPLARRKFRGKAPITALVLSPLVVPHLVFSIALLLLFRFVGDALGIASIFAWPTVILGHVVVLLPIIVLILVPRLQRVDAALEEAAQDLGASGFLTFRSIILPLILPALFSAYLIAFIISFNEFIIAVFISGSATTFPIYVFGQLQYPTELPVVVATTVIVVTISLVVVLAAEFLRRRLERRIDLLSETAGILGVADSAT